MAPADRSQSPMLLPLSAHNEPPSASCPACHTATTGSSRSSINEARTHLTPTILCRLRFEEDIFKLPSSSNKFSDTGKEIAVMVSINCILPSARGPNYSSVRMHGGASAIRHLDRPTPPLCKTEELLSNFFLVVFSFLLTVACDQS